LSEGKFKKRGKKMATVQKSLMILMVMVIGGCEMAERPAFNMVQRLFAAMSAYDYQAMSETVTDDFQLLEDGEIWRIDELKMAVERMEGNATRRNYFSVIKSVPNGDMMWISYWNRADVSYGNNENRSRSWLESVVLKKVAGEWKIHLMHSTVVEPPKAIPGDVIMEEYTD
jgi:ketosteroid isomerase-like protein